MIWGGRDTWGFQSHAGSIEAGLPVGQDHPGIRFQSHAGSIEELRQRANRSSSTYFNPTLVRLRPWCGPGCRPWPCRFQSHAGSIEAGEPGRPRQQSVVFQSHAGSIEGYRWLEGMGREFHFNPTLVRLRPYRASFCGCIRDPFQSHAGSIEALRPRGCQRDLAAAFQSHAGSIEELTSCATQVRIQRFQSHAGSIEAVTHPKPHAGGRRISIPRWFD